ncbi:hypothetical protein ARMGADRAFT_1080888 [Armillaria gallica]|uniref:DUF6535 domain-containing protein n=1 Tax=Armillaria gallica TaxID=47427 RepID=A0A2H3DE77_ARMGA|nr:hypothetical protein ARMGADRAFT_1080888 [Armillaria gallica]
MPVRRTYEDENRIHDANMIDKSLSFRHDICRPDIPKQADYAPRSESLLFDLVLVQRAIANCASVNVISPSPLSPSVAFVSATADVWVNGLWFTTCLFLSLTTALVAVLYRLVNIGRISREEARKRWHRVDWDLLLRYESLGKSYPYAPSRISRF